MSPLPLSILRPIQRACLDRSDLPGLAQQPSLLTPRQATLLDAVRYRLETYPQRFARTEDHAKLSGLLLMSDWDPRHRFCHCSMGNHRCNLVKFCCHCAYVRRKALWARFLPGFEAGHLFFTTIAYDGELDFAPHADAAIPMHWDAATAALRARVGHGEFAGSLWTEELHVRSFCPNLVQPHVHAVIHAETYSPETSDALHAAVANFRGEAFLAGQDLPAPMAPLPTLLSPNIRTFPLQSATDFAAVLAYLVKPLDLVRPYEAAVRRLRAQGRPLLELNCALDEFLAGFQLETFQRRQLDSRGSLDGRCKRRFIGVKESRSHRNQRAALRLLKQVSLEQLDAGSPWVERVAIESAEPPTTGVGDYPADASGTPESPPGDQALDPDSHQG